MEERVSCACGLVFSNDSYWLDHVKTYPALEWNTHGKKLDSAVVIPVRMLSAAMLSSPLSKPDTDKCKAADCDNYSYFAKSYCSRECATDGAVPITPVERRLQKEFGFRVAYPHKSKPKVESGEL